MKKVLVIDDSPEVNRMVGETLQLNGYDVCVAEDGVAGVDLAQRYLPDLILCDVNMPRLDGYATLTALRQQSTTAAIPFIFLTGVAEKASVRQGMELGADDYLTKPFSISDLLGAVTARLEKHSVVVRQAERKLEELRGNISLALPHELILPLSNILGISGLLSETYDRITPSEVFEAATNLEQSALRLRRTVENFLLYSQIELVFSDPARVESMRGGEYPIDKPTLLDLAQQVARRSGREDDLSASLEPGTVAIDGEKLHKVVAELLENAFKFSCAGDEVALAGSMTEDGYRLVITDHGRGMLPEQIAKIGAHMQFERKIHEQQGSGLGLIIAKRLTELHGGTFRIESVFGEQTTVRLEFPRFLVVSSAPL
jgi:DNA-binding response OmpR family regulator/anti-sigma regulatory factor (Ser/Thr protein kinase)